MKECKANDCNNPVFSHGYCKYHQSKRTDNKFKSQIEAHKNTFYFNKTSIPKRSNKKKYGLKNSIKMKYGYESQIEMFKDIWKRREHRSFLSDRDIDGYSDDMWINLFAHVLPKGKYPLFRLNPDNIVLLTPYEHQLFDQGTEEYRARYEKDTLGCEWEKLYNYRDRLREEYEELIDNI